VTGLAVVVLIAGLGNFGAGTAAIIMVVGAAKAAEVPQ